MNRRRDRNFRKASAICYHISSLSHPLIFFFFLINRSEGWEEDILSWQRVPRSFNQTLLHHSYSFSLTGQRDRERERELMMYRLSHSSLLSNLHANADLKLNGGWVKNSTHLIPRAGPSQLTPANHKSLYWRLTSHKPIKWSISTGNWYCWSCTEELWWPERYREDRWKIDLILCTIRTRIYRGQSTVIYYSRQ